MDTNMVRRPDKERDMVHKLEPVLGTVPDKVMDKAPAPGKARKLDMVPGLALALNKASELAPAPAPSMCIPLTADRKAVCHLIDSWTSYHCYSFEVCRTQMNR